MVEDNYHNYTILRLLKMEYNRILFLFYILITPIYAKLTVKFSEKRNDCMLNLVKRNAQEIVYIFGNEDIENIMSDGKPVVLSNKYNLKNIKQYNDLFMIFISKEEDFYVLFDMLINHWKLNTKIIFFSPEFSDKKLLKFFNISWKYFIIDIYIVTDDLIYTYFPYKHGKCGENIQVESYNCSNYTFPSKVPYDLNGCNVRVMAFGMVPYVIDTNEDHTDPSKAGLEVTIMDVIAKKMNFNMVYIPNRHKSWGYKTLEGRYIMMYQSLYDREMDIKMGMSYGNASYLVDFEGSYIYLTEKTVWWVPIALPIAQWKNITAIFQPILWLSIFLVFIINGVVWWLFGDGEDSVWFRNLTLCLIGSLYTLLQGSVPQPNKWKLRMIFIIWLYACLLLFTAHQSSLVSILTTPLYDHQVSTQEELIKKYKFGFYEGALTAFQENTSLHKYIRNNYYQCDLSNLCMNFTAYDRNFAYYKNSRNAKYYLPRLYTSDERKLIYEIEGDGVGVWVGLHTLKRFPLLNRINYLLMQLQADGLMSKWDKDLSYTAKKVESEEHKRLNIKHLQGAFFILFLGVIVSFLVFVGEIIRDKLKNYNFY